LLWVAALCSKWNALFVQADLFVEEQQPRRVVFPQGANSLFIGHSFFVPIAQQFDSFASQSSMYSDHNAQFFKRGGENGSPISLWDNHKEDIELIINSTTPSIELFGMTTGANKTVIDEDALLLGYTQWIDLCLTYNANMAFYIGLPWPDFPSNYTDADAYISTVQQNDILVYELLITQLRDMYPNNDIFYLNYGIIASEMRNILEDGELVGIPNMTGPRGKSIFKDVKGHAGNMLKDMTGLTYLAFFYGTSFQLLVQAAAQFGWDRMNVINIFRETFMANMDYLLFEG